MISTAEIVVLLLGMTDARYLTQAEINQRGSEVACNQDNCNPIRCDVLCWKIEQGDERCARVNKSTGSVCATARNLPLTSDEEPPNTDEPCATDKDCSVEGETCCNWDPVNGEQDKNGVCAEMCSQSEPTDTPNTDEPCATDKDCSVEGETCCNWDPVNGEQDKNGVCAEMCTSERPEPEPTKPTEEPDNGKRYECEAAGCVPDLQPRQLLFGSEPNGRCPPGCKPSA